LNYLAHLLLAENDPLSRVGNLLGDFVAGRPESLELPLRVVQGIVRHRAIDRFADDHPVTARLKALVAPERRRFAGVIVDLVHDHFLTRQWEDYSPSPFRGFIDTCNQALRAHLELLPPGLAGTLEERIADDWLGHYGTDEGLDGVFYRVSLRHPGFAPIRGAVDDLRRHRAEFEVGFHEFFPALQAWVGTLGPEAKVVIDRDGTSA
jgi:acyl carrier protein phosphodiesterase